MDIRQIITDKIISMLENGTTKAAPRWTQSTAGGLPMNRKTGDTYRGINVLLLWAEMEDKSYASSQWLTYRQADEMGAQVRKGEKSVMCVYYSKIARKDDASLDGDEPGSFFMCKPFWLFNVAQIDGLPEVAAPMAINDFKDVGEAERILINSKAEIQYGFDSAYYAIGKDQICLPMRGRFTSVENFYATALHELTHWTGHESRLNRQFGKRFGDDSYAFEELVAELGAAFTVGHLGMLDATIENHADYVASWIKVLKGDKKAIFTAASQASKASDYILAGATAH